MGDGRTVLSFSAGDWARFVARVSRRGMGSRDYPFG